MRNTLESAARDAITSACDDVVTGGESDLVDRVAAGLVARPRSTTEVSEVMRAAAAHGLTVVPRGRGTKISWGMPPSSADLVVDLSAMDDVLDHQAGDLIVDTQAGARLADVQQVVGKQGQRLVLDETVPGASIGGTLATNSSGPLRMLVGTARDLLIGITVVRADGVVAKAGGRVVKNVAGYDLGKLLIGSFGTLAVVTEAVFRLHPVPEVQRWVTAPAADAQQAHDLAHAAIHSQVVPSAVEVEHPPSGPGSVSVQIGGRSSGVDERVSTLRSLLGENAAVSDEAPAGWASYPWGAGDTGLKLTFVLSGLREVLTVADEVGAHVRGSAGTGVVYASVSQQDKAKVAVERLRAVCAKHEGAATVVDAPAAVKQDVDVWGPVPALDLMRRVKDQFDPEHRLAPGRFVGGI
jgi:glycolate oxidase FAD binding subunit